jgi:hypothetical protein
MRGWVATLLDDEQRKAANEQFFKTPKDVLDYLKEVPETVTILQEKSYRLEIGVAVALICSTLVMRRDEIRVTAGDAGLVGAGDDEEAA